MTNPLTARRWGLALFPLLFVLALGTAQVTGITPPLNKFSPAEDVALGRDAAAEVYGRTTIVTDALVGGYLRGLGDRLVGAIPTMLRQPTFVYSFNVVNANDIASFALPGGPIFVSRGMIEAARSEGELAGVLAHQLSHVILRHGTAQATSGERFQIGAITGRTIGAVAGGAGGGIFTLGAGFGVRTYFLMYDPGHERQANLLAAEIMARAGYGPCDIATMFRIFQSEGADHGAWQWMQSHPDLSDGEGYASRDECISRKVETLGIEHSTTSTGHFDLVPRRSGSDRFTRRLWSDQRVADTHGRASREHGRR